MHRALASFGAVAIGAAGVFAQPLTTAFTYQGELADGGTPAAGLHDFQFALFDAPTAGVQVGPLLCADNITLAGGRFTVSLDFGSQFTGQARYLEVRVRPDTGLACGNAAGFTTLTARQPLTAAPNAAFALSAGTAGTASNAGALNGQPASFYTNAANLTGTVADARLSTNIPRLNAASTFSGIPSFNGGTTGSTAPFLVDSSTMVPNLNVDLLDGLDAGAFALSSHSHSHASLSNLGADDHPQYFNQARGDGRYSMLGHLHDAIDITSGTLSDARLTSNIPRLNAAQTFTAVNTFNNDTLFNDRVTATDANIFLNFGARQIQFHNDANLVPGINMTGTSGILGVLRFRNRFEVMPSLDGTRPASLALYNTVQSILLEGASGNGSFSNSLQLDAADGNSGAWNGGTGALRLGAGATGEGLGSARASGSPNRFGLDFYANSSPRLSITNGGNVGIATQSPVTRLHVNGSLHLQGSIQDISVQTGEALQFGHYDGTAFSERMRIEPSGRLNVSSPAAGNGTALMYVSGNEAGNFWSLNSGGWGLIAIGEASADPNAGGQVLVANSGGVARGGIEVNAAGDAAMFAQIKNFMVTNPDDPTTDIYYACVEGPEAAMYVRGTSRLSAGRASVELPRHFAAMAAAEGITVQVTPLSEHCMPLAVTRKATDSFDVAELLKGESASEFDWEVKAIRKGYEDYKVVRPARPRLAPTPARGQDAAPGIAASR
jgi:hypothetical protein